MNMSLLQLIPSAGALLLQFALMRAMAKRNLKSRFPLFFNLVALETASLFVILFVGPHLSGRMYFYTYWTFSALIMLLTFGVLYEVFINILKPFSGLIDLGKLLFAWAAAFLLIASVLTAIATTGHQAAKICAAITLLERSVGLMQCGLLMLLLLFENRLNLSWRSQAMSIALALGISAAVDLISSLLRESVPVAAGRVDTVNAFVYCGMFAFWMVMFSMPQPERKTVQDSPMRLVFQRWNDTLLSTPFAMQSSLSSATMDSFLPNVERTVERVMARKMTQ